MFIGTFTDAVRRVPSQKSHRRSISIPSESLKILSNNEKANIPSSYKQSIMNFDKELAKNYADSTISWALLRHIGMKLCNVDIKQVVPIWKGFRKIVSAKISFPTIGNCRTVPHPPTDINVVYTVLLNVEKMLVNLGQEDCCITVDESIYQMAKQIQWRVETVQHLTIRLGGFHRAKNFMGVLGKRMKSSGFDDILDQSGLYGSTQIEGILKFYILSVQRDF